MQATLDTAPVNKKFEKCLLFIDVQGSPIVRDLNGERIPLPNNHLGRFMARAFYKPMAITPKGLKWYKSKDPLTFPTSKFLVHEPHWYQKLALFRMWVSSCALWFDMGLGKTLCCLGFCLFLYERGRGNVFLILCPPTVFVTWKEELAKHVRSEANAQIIYAHGTKKNKILTELKINPPKYPTFILTTYESLQSILNTLKYLDVAAIFLDESSKIKNLKAQRTQAAFQLIKLFPDAKRFCMSGTPSTTNAKGYYAQYEFCNPGGTGFNSALQFNNHFVSSIPLLRCEMPGGKIINVRSDEDKDGVSYQQRWLERNQPSVDGPSYFDLGYHFSWNHSTNPKCIRILNAYHMEKGVKNLHQLRRLTRALAFPLSKQEVFVNMPQKYFQSRVVELPKKYYKTYEEVYQNNKTEVEGKKFSFGEGSPYQKLHEIANGFLRSKEHVDFFCDHKTKELLALLEECPNEKIIVWAAYPVQLDAISKKLTKDKISNFVMHGGTPVKNRIPLIESFKKPDGPRVALMNPAVAGMGLNLVVCSIQVFINNWWMADVRMQAIDRSHRQGQTNNVMIYDIVTKNTLEMRLLYDLNNNIHTQNRVMLPEELLGGIDGH